MFLPILSVIGLILMEINLPQHYYYLTAGGQVTPPLLSLCLMTVDESKLQR